MIISFLCQLRSIYEFTFDLIRSPIILSLQFISAYISAVNPLFAFNVTSQFFSKSILQMSKNPYVAAFIKAVSPPIV